MNKIILTLLAIFAIGLVAASPGIISNLMVSDFVAGGTSRATFSFDYLEDQDNLPGGSLILRLNMSSMNENYPVWKNDFSASGFIEQFTIFGFLGLEKITPLQCLEEDEINFLNSNGLLHIHKDNIPGVFYCYDPNNYFDMLDIGRRDDVTLDISSNPALHPGEYQMSVELMKMEKDVSPPVMELSLDDFIFDGSNTIPISLNIMDMYNIANVEYEIINPELSEFYSSGWIEIEFNETSGLYEDEFNMTKYNLNESGSYWIKARSCDVLDNCGEL